MSLCNHIPTMSETGSNLHLFSTDFTVILAKNDKRLNIAKTSVGRM